MPKWDSAQSKELYNIRNWGDNIFDIDPDGELRVLPNREHRGVSLYKIAGDLTDRGFSFPVLVRFPDVLRHRVTRLCNAFSAAMDKENYHADYTLVYPIKVNQQRCVVETIVNTGMAGLETGSKSEMMAVLGLGLPHGSIVICNGYKDREYVRMALIAQKMGLRPYIVIEKTTELKLIIEEAVKAELMPFLGIRIRLAFVGRGKWQDSGGGKSKFGLNSAQMIDAINFIRDAGLINSLQLMHFHAGSQIPNIHDIQNILAETGRFYAELRAMGVPIKIIDAGGGLGVDYEGMFSSRPFSKNYTIEEYANNIVYAFNEICTKMNLPRPDIITETGRAVTAHHTVLITNIIEAESVPALSEIRPASDKDPEIIQDLWYQLNNIDMSSALERYHNAVYWLNDLYIMFSYGAITLTQRVHAEQLFYSICLKVRDLFETNLHSRAYREAFEDINDKLKDKYFANFSLFSSAPDAWALEQLFPVMPLHRLNEYPDRRATIHDLTCDSDGQFKKYVHSNGIETNLPVHSFDGSAPYLIGIFLLGAYQEILGDMHNLFGTAHSVNVCITKNDEYTVSDALKGDTVQTVLASVNFDEKLLLKRIENSLECTFPDEEQKLSYIQEIKTVLRGYTY